LHRLTGVNGFYGFAEEPYGQMQASFVHQDFLNHNCSSQCNDGGKDEMEFGQFHFYAGFPKNPFGYV